jgi:hypothetical protein
MVDREDEIIITEKETHVTNAREALGYLREANKAMKGQPYSADVLAPLTRRNKELAYDAHIGVSLLITGTSQDRYSLDPRDTPHEMSIVMTENMASAMTIELIRQGSLTREEAMKVFDQIERDNSSKK